MTDPLDRRPHVVFEMYADGEWQRVGSVSDIEPPGTFSTHTPTGRDVYAFGWHDGQGPAVWKSTGGFDVANEAVRALYSTGLEIVDLLDDEHSVHLEFQRGALALPVRFRYERAAP
jgi:hypothetical protein